MAAGSKESIQQCPECGGYFSAGEGKTTLCPYCLDTRRIPVGIPLVKGALGDPDLKTYHGPGGKDVLLTKASWAEETRV